MARLKLPKALARYTNGTTEIEVSETTLKDTLAKLTNDYNLGTAILRDDGSIQPYIGVVVGGELLNKAALTDPSSIEVTNKEIQLKTAFAGG
ncbi:MAG: MoaD/ThiS family protein [Paracoccaceae bacterium]|jgi:hypothetical protein|nr:MoaD/ThiS family protein [Paracoccaceae bacterium]